MHQKSSKKFVARSKRGSSLPVEMFLDCSLFLEGLGAPLKKSCRQSSCSGNGLQCKTRRASLVFSPASALASYRRKSPISKTGKSWQELKLLLVAYGRRDRKSSLRIVTATPLRLTCDLPSCGGIPCNMSIVGVGNHLSRPECFPPWIDQHDKAVGKPKIPPFVEFSPVHGQKGVNLSFLLCFICYQYMRTLLSSPSF